MKPLIHKQELIDELNELIQKYQFKHITQREYLKISRYSIWTIHKHFGSFNKFLLFSNLDVVKNIPDEILFADIRSCLSKTKLQTISPEMYRRFGKYKIALLNKRFGSWNNILLRLGLRPISRFFYSDEELLWLIQDFYIKFGRVPGIKEFEQTDGYPSGTIYYKRFKCGWPEIIKLAGLQTQTKFLGLDNNWYDSRMELNIANILCQKHIKYQSHKKICDTRKWTCNFYIPTKDLWIEFDGFEERRKEKIEFQEKLQYYKDNGFNFNVITKNDNILDIVY